MREIDLRRDPKPEIAASACKNCNSKQRCYVPQPSDVPMPLRGLSQEAVEALRPLDIDVGPVTRSTTHYGKPNGYRQKVQMIRFYLDMLVVVLCETVEHEYGRPYISSSGGGAPSNLKPFGKNTLVQFCLVAAETATCFAPRSFAKNHFVAIRKT